MEAMAGGIKRDKGEGPEMHPAPDANTGILSDGDSSPGAIAEALPAGKVVDVWSQSKGIWLCAKVQAVEPNGDAAIVYDNGDKKKIQASQVNQSIRNPTGDAKAGPAVDGLGKGLGA